MPTITTVPQYPIPERPAKLSVSLTGSGADYVRIWVTDAPEGSSYRKNLDEGDLGRFQIYEGDAAQILDNLVFDKGGAFTLAAQEYTLLAGSHGGGFENDPDAAPKETKVGGETSLTVYIGQRMQAQIGANGDTADLILYVWNDTIRATTKATHGIKTPRIQNPATSRAASAIAATAVKTKLQSLVNVTASAAIGTLGTIADDLVTNYNAHLTETGVHDTDDTDNSVTTDFAEAPTLTTLPRIVGELLSKLRRHMTNDGGLGPGTAGTDPASGDTTPNPYHNNGGAKSDWTNLPLFESASAQTAYGALADFHRAFEAHRTSSVHDADDTTNTLATLPALLQLYSAFYSALAALSPTVPSTQSTAAVLLMQQAAFRES